MCVHCENKIGKPIKVEKHKYSPVEVWEQPDEVQIFNTDYDEVPGIVLFRYGSAFGYFDIHYCPMCGRKLKDE